MEYGVDPKLALWIVKHESHSIRARKGDGEASRGLWQISKIYHPEVSDAMAFNVASSTDWSLERIRAGKATNGPVTGIAELCTRIARFSSTCFSLWLFVTS